MINVELLSNNLFYGIKRNLVLEILLVGMNIFHEELIYSSTHFQKEKLMYMAK